MTTRAMALLVSVSMLGCAPTRPTPDRWVQRARLDPTDGIAALEAGELLLFHRSDRGRGEELLAAAARADGTAGDARLLLAYSALRDRDYGLLLERVLPFVESRSWDWRAEVALWMLDYAESTYPGYPARVSGALEELLANPGAAPHARWYAGRRMGTECRRRHDEVCLRRVTGTLGKVTRWLVSGPYGLAPALDFDEPLAEERARPVPGCTEPHTMSRDPEVCTREVYTLEGPVTCPRWGRGGTCLAWSWIHLGSPTRVLVTVESRDSVALSVDGIEVVRMDRFRELPPGREDRWLWLGRGWHGLALKMSSSGRPQGARVFLTGPDPLGGWRAEPPAGEPGKAVLIDDGPDTWGACRILDHASEHPRWAMLMAALGRSACHAPIRAEAAAERLIGERPGSAEAMFLMGDTISRDPTLPDKVARSRARAWFERAVHADPRHLLGHLRLGMLEKQDGELDRALERFERCTRLAPTYPWAHFRMFQIFRDRGWEVEATESLQAAMALSGSPPMARWASRFWEDVGAISRMREARRTYLRRVPSLFPSQAAMWAQEAGRLGEAMGLWESMGRVDTISTEPPRRVYDLARLMGREDVAREALDEWMRRDPLDPGAMVASVLEADDSLVPVANALELEPWNLDVWRLASELEGTSPFPASNADRILERYRSTEHPGWETRDMVVIHEARQDVLLGRGGGYRIYEKMVLVQTKRAADAIGERRIPPGGLLLEFRTIKPDGTVLEPELGQGKADISFTGLEVGDVAHYRYVAPLRPTLPGHGFAGRYYIRYVNQPVFHTELELCYPEHHPMKVVGRGPTEKTWRPGASGSTGMFHLLNLVCDELEAGPVEPVEPEVATPPPSEWLDWVWYGYSIGEAPMDRVARALLARLVTATRRDPRVEALAAELAGPDPIDTATRAYSWVRDEVTGSRGTQWFSPSAGRTLAERRGSRTALLASILRSAGVEHQVLLARSRQDEALGATLPSMSWYHIPLIRVARPEGGWLYLAPTMDHATAGYLPDDLQGAEAMILAGARREIITLPRLGPSDRWSFEVGLSLDPRGDAQGHVEVTGEGASTGRLREIMAGLSAEERGALVERLLARQLGGLEVERLTIDGLDDSDRPVIVTAQVRVPGLATVTGDRLTLDHLAASEMSTGWNPWARPLSSYLRTFERRLPLMTDPMWERLHLVLRLPRPGSCKANQGKKVFEIGPLHYEQEIRCQGSEVVLTRQETVEVGRVPVPGFPELRAALVALERSRAEGLTVVLEPHRQRGTPDRVGTTPPGTP